MVWILIEKKQDLIKINDMEAYFCMHLSIPSQEVEQGKILNRPGRLRELDINEPKSHRESSTSANLSGI